MRAVVERWLSTQLTQRGHVRLQATGHELQALRSILARDGRVKTLAAIDRAASSAEGGSPKLALLQAIAERGVYEQPPPTRRRGSTPTHDPKRVNDAWAGVPDQGDTF